jgi:cobalt/nickel transport system ATP-binding protein
VRARVADVSAIELAGLSYTYADGSRALRGVSFALEENECVGLIGPNGAGKSTLLLHLNGVLPEAIGDDSPVRVFGEPITRANVYEVRRTVGLLFQDPDDQLFCPTVFEDVAFGPQQFGGAAGDLRGLVADALARVGLVGFESRSAHHLSRGEKKRVCLAGLLACQSRVLVLDEPTSDLDPRGRRELKQLLQRITATKLIASHDLEMVVELCSRVIVLDDGEVVAQGPTIELLSDEALMLAHGLERPHILKHLHPHP